MCSFSRENVDLAAALLTLASMGEGKEVSWTHEPQLKALLAQHSLREASRYQPDAYCFGVRAPENYLEGYVNL